MDWITFLLGVTAIVLPPAMLGFSLLWYEDTLKAQFGDTPHRGEYTGTDLSPAPHGQKNGNRPARLPGHARPSLSDASHPTLSETPLGSSGSTHKSLPSSTQSPRLPHSALPKNRADGMDRGRERNVLISCGMFVEPSVSGPWGTGRQGGRVSAHPSVHSASRLVLVKNHTAEIARGPEQKVSLNWGLVMQQTVAAVSLPITAGLLALGMPDLILLQYVVSLVLCLLAWVMAVNTTGDRAARNKGTAPLHVSRARTGTDGQDTETPLRLAA